MLTVSTKRSFLLIACFTFLFNIPVFTQELIPFEEHSDGDKKMGYRDLYGNIIVPAKIKHIFLWLMKVPENISANGI